MEELQILDELLKIFSIEPRQRAFNVPQLQDEFLKKHPSFIGKWSKDLTEEYLEKLIKDKYVRNDTKDSERAVFGRAIQYYKITIEGIIFIKADGYQQKLIDDISENNRLKALEISQLSQGKTLNDLTLYVAVGSIGILIIEFAKVVWHNRYFFCH